MEAPIIEQLLACLTLETQRADEQQRRADEQQRRADEQQRRADGYLSYLVSLD